MLKRLVKMWFFFTVLMSVVISAKAVELKHYKDKINSLSQASLVLQRSNANDEIQIHSNKLLVPASTLKIVTAYLAIKRWGLTHRFHTDFYVSQNTLWVKGYGDPYITSEEIALMSEQIKALGLTNIERIAIDNSFFPELRLNGRGSSDNPYDAGNAAVVVNFNTAYIQKIAGKLSTAEKQTPLTPLAIELANDLGRGFKKGSKRISLPGGRDQSARYFGEVFSSLHFGKNLDVSISQLPVDAKLVYRHFNSKELKELLTAMLKYSNNFIANQLFLLMPERDEAQTMVNIDDAQKNYIQALEKEFSFKGVNIVDGAGLSRLNKISAQQLTQILQQFKPWIELLPERHKGIKAKTGTLSDNHSLAGFILDKEGAWQAFALLINKSMPANYRYQLAKELLDKS
jgi:D-alanyl-D-alanine carboxypeptidase/D-alanyl-D-alanine-endopeptidase (penicillin-binding protein 4)